MVWTAESRRSLAIALVAAVLAAAACGEDESGTGSGATGGGGGTGGAGASTGGGGSAGSGATGASGGGGAAASAGAGNQGGDSSAGDAAADALVDITPTDGWVNIAACRVLWQDIHRKLDECSLPYGVAGGSQYTEAWVFSCSKELAAEGVVAVKEDVQACANRFQQLDCAALLDSAFSRCRSQPDAIECTRLDPSSIPGCDMPAGTLSDGSPCYSHLACQSSWCEGIENGCGHCAPRPKAGEGCTSFFDCDQGLGCAANGVCASIQSLGASCTDATACPWGSSCVSGQCTAWAASGAACADAAVSNLPTCDLRQSLVCEQGTCKSVVAGNIGGSCGQAPSQQCRIDALCWQGSCVARVHDGGVCDSTRGSECLAFSSCRAGVCSEDDPAYCR